MEEKEKNKTLNIFTAASFLNDFGSDMIYPIWPLFVTSFAGVNMEVLGLIDGLGDAIVSISQALSGYVADRIRRRKVFVWIGYIFGGFSRVGYALTKTWQPLIGYRVLDRAGKMRGAPRDAIIADISTAQDRGRNFGFLRTFDNLGAVFGIVFTILFFSALGYRNLFLIAAVPSLLGAALVFSTYKERKPTEARLYKGIAFGDLDNNFRFFLLLSAIFALGSFSYSFLLIFADRFGFKTAFVPVLYLIFTLVASVMSLPLGKLSDKLKSRKIVLVLTYFFWILVCVIFIAGQSKLFLILAFVLYGAHRAGIDTVQKTLAAELAPEQFRASGLGTFELVVGLCALPASLLAGYFWDKINPAMPFYVSLCLSLVSLAMLLFVKEKTA